MAALYGFSEASTLLHRELVVQRKLAHAGKHQVLHIPATMGPVGGGKSAMHQAEVARFWDDLFFAAFNCGENSDATDMTGLPIPSMVGNLIDTMNDPAASLASRKDARGLFTMWVLNKYAALACIQPVYLFFDDIDKAPPPVQAALLAILATRRFRDQAIHPLSLLAAAGNREEDDESAFGLSESMRTRLTIIPMKADVVSFCEYGKETGEIHPIVRGFVNYKPELLHAWKEGVYRFPTPRGWWEVSQMFEQFPDPFEDVFKNGTKDNWKTIVSRKCGDHVANDFWAWFKIISRVKPEEVLKTGDIPYATLRDEDGNQADRRMAQYATIFAVAQHLASKGVKKEHTGLEKLVDDLEPEHQVAFVVQLPLKTRKAIGKVFTDTADIMMGEIVRTANDTAVLVPQT